MEAELANPSEAPVAPHGRGNTRGRGAVRGQGRGLGAGVAQQEEVQQEEVQQEEVQQEEVQQDVQMSHNMEEEVGGQEQEVNQENENVHASQEIPPEH